MKKLLQPKKGYSHIMTCCFALAICMIWSLLLFYQAGVSVAQAQRKSAEQILDQYIQNNGIWIYAQIKNEGSTTETLLTEQYITYLTTQQGLTYAADGKYYAYDADGEARYAVDNVQLHYMEDDLPKLQLTYTLHYPLRIFGSIHWVEIPAYAYSRFNPKFDQ